MSRPVRVLVALLVVAACVVAGFVTVPATADAGAEADFVDRIDGARAGRGLGALQVDGELTAIARRWSQRMADENRLSHNPNLSREVTHDWEKLAENVGYGGDTASIHEAFMNSSAHAANILDGALTHVGVGVVRDGSGQLWVTEVFMRLRSGSSGGAAPPTPAPPPASTAAPPPAPTARPRPAPAPAPTAAPTAPATPPPTAPTPPTTAAAEPPAPAPEPLVTAAAAPSSRLVLVLDRLVALDEGR